MYFKVVVANEKKNKTAKTSSVTNNINFYIKSARRHHDFTQKITIFLYHCILLSYQKSLHYLPPPSTHTQRTTKPSPSTWCRASRVKYIEEQARARAEYCCEVRSTSMMVASVSSTLVAISFASFFNFSRLVMIESSSKIRPLVSLRETKRDFSKCLRRSKNSPCNLSRSDLFESTSGLSAFNTCWLLVLMMLYVSHVYLDVHKKILYTHI